jgi:hypothetical protein
LVELRMDPEDATTHSETDGHETTLSPGAGANAMSLTRRHAPAPAVGFVELSTSPAPNATHSDTNGHEMLESPLPSPRVAELST